MKRVSPGLSALIAVNFCRNDDITNNDIFNTTRDADETRDFWAKSIDGALDNYRSTYVACAAFGNCDVPVSKLTDVKNCPLDNDLFSVGHVA